MGAGVQQMFLPNGWSRQVPGTCLWWATSSSVLATQRALPKGCLALGAFAELMVLAGGCPSVLTLLVVHPKVPSCCSPACCSVAGTGVGAARWVPCGSCGGPSAGTQPCRRVQWKPSGVWGGCKVTAFSWLEVLGAHRLAFHPWSCLF